MSILTPINLVTVLGDSREVPQREGPATVGQDQVSCSRGVNDESVCHHHQVRREGGREGDRRRKWEEEGGGLKKKMVGGR